MAACRALDAGTLDAALAEVRARVLVIQTTTRDPQTGKRAPMKVGERSPCRSLKKQARELPVEVLPGLGHFPQLEAPERVNGLIAEFCR